MKSIERRKKTMKRDFLLVVLLASLVLLSFAGCGGNDKAEAPGQSSQKVITIKTGGTVPDSHPISIGMYAFGDALKDLSGGQLKGEHFSNLVLGGQRDIIEMVQNGAIQGAECSIAVVAGFSDEVTITSLPFLFPSREVAYEFMDGKYGQQLSDQVASDSGIRFLGYMENGIRMLSNSKRSIETPADMKGLKFRVMESPIYIKMFQAFGAAATPMSFAEVYTGLQQGTVDGQDNPWALTVAQKFYEVNHYVTDLGHTFDFAPLMINEDFYQGLTDEQKGWVDEAAKAAVKANREACIAADDANIAILKENTVYTELTDEQRQAFKIAAQPVYDWYISEYNDKVRLTEWQAEIDKIANK